MKLSDKKRIFSKLDEMMTYVKELQEMVPEKDDYIHNLISRRACEKTIEIAIESLIGLSAMIVSSERFGLPTSEENIFDTLVKHNAIPKQLGDKLKDLKGFRNILVHRYAHVNDEIVHHNLINFLDDFSDFKNAIELYAKDE